MNSPLQNRFGAVQRLLDRYYAGQAPASFTQQEREVLRNRLMESPAFRDTKHAEYARVSADVRDMFLADPGAAQRDVGWGKEFAPTGDAGSDGTPSAPANTLFRGQS